MPHSISYSASNLAEPIRININSNRIASPDDEATTAPSSSGFGNSDNINYEKHFYREATLDAERRFVFPPIIKTTVEGF